MKYLNTINIKYINFNYRNNKQTLQGIAQDKYVNRNQVGSDQSNKFISWAMQSIFNQKKILIELK